MKPLFALFTVIVFGMMVASPVMAGDKEDVVAAINKYNTAWNTGNIDVLNQSLVPGYTVFGVGLLNGLPDPKRLGFKAFLEAGNKTNLSQLHQEIAIYGNTAILTAYEVVSTTQADGTTTPPGAPSRTTMVWVKQSGVWKMAHQHQSALTLPSP